MPLFICDKCNVIENTALGFYWSRNRESWTDASLNRLALCSECTPKIFADGSKTGLGKWHGKFPKEIATKETVLEIGLENFVISRPLDVLFDAQERRRILDVSG